LSPSTSSSGNTATADSKSAPAVPAFFARPPRHRRSSSTTSTSTTASTSSKDALGHRRLEWTDARVRAVWDCVAQLGASGAGWGVVRCDAWWPPDEEIEEGGGGRAGEARGAGEAAGEGAERRGGGAEGPSAWPAMLRIMCPAHLALALRGLLAQVSVSALARAGRRRREAARSEGGVRVGEGGRKGEGEGEEDMADEEEEDEDDDRFLRGRRLLWVDEEGAPVLIA